MNSPTYPRWLTILNGVVLLAMALYGLTRLFVDLGLLDAQGSGIGLLILFPILWLGPITALGANALTLAKSPRPVTPGRVLGYVTVVAAGVWLAWAITGGQMVPV